MFDFLLVALLGCLHVLQPRNLILLQPLGLPRKIREIEKHAESHQNRRQRFKNEQPLPAFQPQASQVQQHSRDRRPDNGRNRDCQHEVADDPRAIYRRKPQGQIKDDAGKEARLACAEQQPKGIENRFVRNADCPRNRRDKGERGRDDPPGDHDAGNPNPRANPFQKEVRRHLKQKIGNEEKSGAQSEGGLAEAKRLVHMQLGEADIDAIQIRNEIAQDQKRYQPPHHLADCTPFDVFHGGLRSSCAVWYFPGKFARVYSATVACLNAKPGGPFPMPLPKAVWCAAVEGSGYVSTLTPPSAVTRPFLSITICVASWRSSAASWLT